MKFEKIHFYYHFSYSKNGFFFLILFCIFVTNSMKQSLTNKHLRPISAVSDVANAYLCKDVFGTIVIIADFLSETCHTYSYAFGIGNTIPQFLL